MISREEANECRLQLITSAPGRKELPNNPSGALCVFYHRIVA